MLRHRTQMMAALIALVLTLGVLGLYRTSPAVAPPAEAQLPFRNAVDQREQMIRELQEIKELLREQNGLLQQVLAKNSNQ